MIDVVLPVLDEAEALRWVLPRIPVGYRPIVVDNASTDGSAEVAAELGAVVVSEPRRGFGSACFAGLTRAETDVVCFMDCDASMDPRHLTAITAPVLELTADLVLGARQPEPGAWPLHARVANRWLARDLRRRTGAALTDLGPMRAAHREALLGLALRDRRSGWPLEMVLAAAAAGWTLAERPVPYLPRTGRSKVTGTVGGTVRAVKDIRAQLRSFRPHPPGARVSPLLYLHLGPRPYLHIDPRPRGAPMTVTSATSATASTTSALAPSTSSAPAPSTSSAPAPRADVGVFGGSGLTHLLTDSVEVDVQSAWGEPSGPVTIGDVDGRTVAFLPRHGTGHRVPPHRVNYRANVDVMRQLGVSALFGPFAAGSLRPDLTPGTVVVVDQFVDRTSGRAETFHDSFDDGPRHLSLPDPYDADLRARLLEAAGRTGLPVVDGGTVVIVNGPRFSTRAESRWFRAQGWDLVNMTQHPEAVLAAEAGLPYAGLAIVTDHDAGLEDDPDVAPVTQDEVFAVFERTVAEVRTLLCEVVRSLPDPSPHG